MEPSLSTRPFGLEDLAAAFPFGRLLSNGRCTALVTVAGTGYVECDGLALTRWRGDPVEDVDGLFLYIRDLEGGMVWSAGHQPVRHRPARYSVRFDEGSVTYEREDEGIETRLEVTVSSDEPAEIRRLTLTNRSDRVRRLDVTSYAEVVLAPRAADRAHPAFSKLFVQTERVEERPILLARRRPRGADEEPRWLVHALLGTEGDVSHETDRARFIGRGRGLAAPAALDPEAFLSGTTGCVLDPIVSLRHSLVIPPGEASTLLFVLGTATSRAGALALAERFSSGDTDAFTLSGAHEADIRERLGLSREDAARLQTRLVGRLYTGADSDTSDEIVAYGRAIGLPEALLASGAAGQPWKVRESMPLLFSGPGNEALLHPALQEEDPTAGPPDEPLLFFNGTGGFSVDGTEYVIRMGPDAQGRPQGPPLPWANVMANPRAGIVATERGAMHTWAGNSRENRLTPWSNDPISDPHGEALYVREEESGAFWSPTPGPVPAPATYEVRHGFGYTRYTVQTDGLVHDTLVFVPTDDPVRFARLRLTNTRPRQRRLSVFSYARLVLGGLPEETASHIVTELADGAVLARNPSSPIFGERIAFACALTSAEVRCTADRTAFLGPYGTLEAPLALTHDEPMASVSGPGLDPCAAFQVPLVLGAGETAEVTFLLGQGDTRTEALDLLEKYRLGDAIQAAQEGVRAFWNGMLSAIQVETPEPTLDLLINGWLVYQDLSCRIWGRSAFYQSGGAYGFRDQLQDALALVYTRPDLTRHQLLLHAAHQFVEGDVLHWWHPPAAQGIRTRFSDDLLWLPYATSFYLKTTGDVGALDEVVPFLTARELEEGEDEAFLQPESSGEEGSLFEHCCRALDRSLTSGAHGLPLMGTGDWNDGMNRVGREGRGESVWLGFFLYDILDDFIPICIARGDAERASRYRAYQISLHTALNDAGWDGEWYRRAYYDSGAVLGSAENDECRIDAIAQAWAVLSGAAPPDRARQALDALEQHLVDEEAGIIRLLTPAFDQTPHDPGYIKGYVPGVRENGGQYTHAALWAVRALAAAGRRDRAAHLLAMLSPVSHTATAEGVARYMTEPYVVAADVYGVAPHVGRGGWTWYTGSAGWMYRVALESILGMTIEGGDTLVIRPCIPQEWPGFFIRYAPPGGGATYEVFVSNVGAGQVIAATLDGEAIEVDQGAARAPLRPGVHRLEVQLG